MNVQCNYFVGDTHWFDSVPYHVSRVSIHREGVGRKERVTRIVLTFRPYPIYDAEPVKELTVFELKKGRKP